MAISRYKKTGIVANDLDEFAEDFAIRGVQHINHHRTVKLKKASSEDSKDLHNQFHLWKQADRFWKLAHKYYGNSEYWWVIAQYNQKPTEAHIQNGDIVIVPMPLRSALKALGH